MRLESQSRWHRVLIEVFLTSPVIRRYRPVPSPLEGATRRLLNRQIHRQLRGSAKARP